MACLLLCKALVPVSYLVALILHLGFRYAYYLLSLIYTTAHLQVPLIPKTNLTNSYE